jgi:hypothetical protein
VADDESCELIPASATVRIEATLQGRPGSRPEDQRRGQRAQGEVRCIVSTSAKVDLEIEVPEDLARLHLPEGVDRRLQALLDKQDGGTPLTPDEQAEAEGLVDLADLLTLLRLRASRSTPTPG